MKKWRVIAASLLAAGMGYLLAYVFISPTPAPLVTESERFPIVSRFELQRNYGYFIGDEIPLTLIIETMEGTVLDLVNLPRQGEKHGLFEVRDVKITSSSPSTEQKLYRAEYTLQYFGATPLTTHFEALEILYALPADRVLPAATYTYKSLLTQPVAINIARIGPYQPTQGLPLKGPMDDRRVALVWVCFIVGAILFLIAFRGWGLEWRRRWRRYRSPLSAPLTAVENVLQLLRQEGVVFHPPGEPAFPVGVRLSHIMRQYLHAQFGLPALTLATAELATHLRDKPFYEDMLQVLERCDTLKYQTPAVSQAEERQLWWESLALFEKMQKVSAS